LHALWPASPATRSAWLVPEAPPVASGPPVAPGPGAALTSTVVTSSAAA